MPNIIRLNARTICPTENDVFLLITIATLSVPSTQPPKWITIPTPIPYIAPPNTVASNISSTNAGTCSKKVKKSENEIIEIIVLYKKFLPRFL